MFKEKLAKMFNTTEDLFGIYLNGLLIAGMMFFIAGEVIFRYVFGISFPAVVDIVTLAIIVLVFCPLGVLQREEAHLTIDLITEKIEGKKLGAVNDFFVKLITLACCLFLAYASYVAFSYTFRIKVTTLAAHLPKWVAVIFIPISLALLAIRVIIQLVNAFRKIRDVDYNKAN